MGARRRHGPTRTSSSFDSEPYPTIGRHRGTGVSTSSAAWRVTKRTSSPSHNGTPSRRSGHSPARTSRGQSITRKIGASSWSSSRRSSITSCTPLRAGTTRGGDAEERGGEMRAQAILTLLLLFVCGGVEIGCSTSPRSVAAAAVDPEITAFIGKLRAVDNHSHANSVAPGDSDQDALPPEVMFPFEVPVQLRPDNPDWLTAYK